MKLVGLLEQLVGLAGKADDHVRSQPHVRHFGGAGSCQPLEVLLESIVATHAAQHGSGGAGLQRHLQVRGQPRIVWPSAR